MLQARTQMREVHFREFQLPQPDPAASGRQADTRGAGIEIRFALDISTLLDCATIFGGLSGVPFTANPIDNDVRRLLMLYTQDIPTRTRTPELIDSARRSRGL